MAKSINQSFVLNAVILKSCVEEIRRAKARMPLTVCSEGKFFAQRAEMASSFEPFRLGEARAMQFQKMVSGKKS